MLVMPLILKNIKHMPEGSLWKKLTRAVMVETIRKGSDFKTMDACFYISQALGCIKFLVLDS